MRCRSREQKIVDKVLASFMWEELVEAERFWTDLLFYGRAFWDEQTGKRIDPIEIVEATRSENDQISFIRKEFVECPTCAAKSGMPDLCPECLERRELWYFWKEHGGVKK